MNYIQIKKTDIANGPGVRVSLWVSGCEKHCKGCFNESAWPFEAGEPFSQDVADDIIRYLLPDYIQGLTILGGEPLNSQNYETVMSLVELIWNTFYWKKDIWIYTGYTYQELFNKIRHDYRWNFVTCLVDGPFIEEKKDISLKFRGSTNQKIINLH